MEFFWRVRVANMQDSSAWSAAWRFTTISPATDVPADTVSFSWHNVDNADTFFLEVSSGDNFIADYFSVSTTDTFCSIILFSPAGMDYYWHVQAINSTDTSDWSETWKFTTEEANRLDDEYVKPTTSYILQNRPNPFNPSTVISYQLANNSFVRLKIYDLNGKEVQTLVSQQQNAGSYSVSFDASALPSGIYFYRLSTSNGFSQSRKMILLK